MAGPSKQIKLSEKELLETLGDSDEFSDSSDFSESENELPVLILVKVKTNFQSLKVVRVALLLHFLMMKVIQNRVILGKLFKENSSHTKFSSVLPILVREQT